MYETERRYMAAANIPSIDLMERAALEFTAALEARAGGFAGKRVAVACGAGSNDGDALINHRRTCFSRFSTGFKYQNSFL